MPSKTAEKKEQKIDVTKGLLAAESDIRAAVDDAPDDIKAAYNNILGAISQLKDALATHESLQRPPPRDRGFTEKPQAPGPYRTAG